MTTVRAWVVRSPVTAFYILTLLLSWGYWLTLLARGVQVGVGTSAASFLGLMGPLLAAIAVTWITSGSPGIADLASRTVRLPRPRLRSVLLAVSPLITGAVIFGALRLLGHPLPPAATFTQFASLPWGWAIPVVLGLTVLNGFGEEVGWRGFATPHLLARFGRFRATLIVGGLWVLWHAPLFALNAGMHAMWGRPVMLGWAFSLMCGAFVLASLYLNCSQSILVVAVWHATFNMVVSTEAGTGTPAAVVSTVVMVWGVAVALWWWRSEWIARSRLT